MFNTNKTTRTNDIYQHITQSERQYAKLIYSAISLRKNKGTQVDIYWNSFLVLEIKLIVNTLKRLEIKSVSSRTELVCEFIEYLENKSAANKFIVLRPDFICPKYGFIIEIDGDSHHHPDISIQDKFKELIYEVHLGFNLKRFENYNDTKNVDHFIKSMFSENSNTNKFKRKLQNLRKNSVVRNESDELHNWFLGKRYSGYAESQIQKTYITKPEFCDYPTQISYCGFRTSIGLKITK